MIKYVDKEQKKARITWNRDEDRWVLELWTPDDPEWTFSKAWSVAHHIVDVDFVSDSVLIEIADLQALGWDVKVLL